MNIAQNSEISMNNTYLINDKSSFENIKTDFEYLKITDIL